jgi:hypothetical protein
MTSTWRGASDGGDVGSGGMFTSLESNITPPAGRRAARRTIARRAGGGAAFPRAL